jgi:hypothetical protein
MKVKVSFTDLVDLRSRLVLLPRVEDLGLGAVVADYKPRIIAAKACETKAKLIVFDDCDCEANADNLKHDPSCAIDTLASGGVIVERDEECLMSSIDAMPFQKTPNSKLLESPSVQLRVPVDAPDKVKCSDTAYDISPEDIVGKSLVAMDGLEREKDWLVQDFSLILASLRDVKPPIVLHFDSAPLGMQNEIEEQDEAMKQETYSHQDETPAAVTSWSLWGKSFAATAASSAKVYASATAVAVARAAEEARAARLAKPSINGRHHDQRCCLCLHVGDGRFVELSGSLQKLPKVTTTSELVVREAPSRACPRNGYRYEWYRLLSMSIGYDISSNPSNPSPVTTNGDGTQFHGENQNWALLDGATSSSYQPCANDIGHRLRCVVFLESSDEELEFADCNSEERIVLETPAPIAADMAMFNGARQALLRGAHFGSLVGRGLCEGRIFGITVSITLADDKSISSAISIQQFSGTTAEPIHQGVIKQACAIADPANPKYFDLVFLLEIPQGSMLSALSTDGRFQLIAPNRTTREMLLLALGIANFSGRPADLTDTTVLYPGLVYYPGATVQDAKETPAKQVIERNEDVFFTPDEESSRLINELDEQKGTLVNTFDPVLQQIHSENSGQVMINSALQMQLAQSDEMLQMTELDLSSCRKDLQRAIQDSKDCQAKLRLAEARIESNEAAMDRVKADFSKHVESLENRVLDQSHKIADLEKTLRSQQNEKAVLTAAIEARDRKLEKMKGLETALDTLSVKVAKGDTLRSEMTEMGKRYEILCNDLEKVATSEIECKEELRKTLSTMNEICESLESEKARRKQCQAEVDTLQRIIQVIKTERNNYKQKADSLAKELSRICRGGRTLRDVEKVLIDEESRKTEINVLRAQKKEALDNLQQYRAAYEQQLIAQLNIGIDGAAIKALEQKAELERVVSDLTEYINAKEMQLQTMVQINQALTHEMKQLAKASMGKDEI